MSANINIIPVDNQARTKQFLDLPYTLYRDDPNWRAPLRMERAAQIDPNKNPSLKGIEFQFFLAEKNGKIVGRVAAIVNSIHLEHYADNTGHFGFLDAEEDPAIMTALMPAVENWLKERGMTRIVGPFNMSINEEIGLQISGFDTPPMLMMPFGRPDYQTSIESLGYEKDIDVEAYVTNVEDAFPHPKIVNTMCKVVDDDPRVTVRHMNMANFSEEVDTAMEIFNDAWSDNWGFIPFSDKLIKHIAKELKPIIVKDLFWVCEVDGKPAGFALMVPNINEAAHGLNGRLLPFGWIKLLFRLKVKGLKTGRIMLMGVRKEYQKTKLGMAMTATLSSRIFSHGLKRGIKRIEMSWILETNKSMIRVIKLGQGQVYKTYRMYKKDLN
jgi:GNAT superfamily N-acetyltransferase